LKKIIAYLFVFLLTMIFANAVSAEKISVGLYYGESSPSEVAINCDGQDLTVNREDISEEGLVFSSSDIIKVNNISYNGDIIIKKDASGNITVINEVEMEDYVSSVIAKEMSPSFEKEALKAQAVCARTYAIASVGRHSMFDVCATVHCQVYAGASCADGKTADAAEQTKGEILTYNGQPAQTVYFAASGGYTESAKFIWGSDTPYLTAVSDEFEDADCYLHKWTKEISPSQITNILSSKGYNIGEVKDIKIIEQTPNGVVHKLSVIGDLGEELFKNEWCRILFGGLLPSQAYNISRDGAATLKTYYGTVSLSDISILSADGYTRGAADTLYIKGGSNSTAVTPGLSGNFVFTGRGNGHLVGMSQNGANGMARAGFSYDEILTHYYSGTEIIRIED